MKVNIFTSPIVAAGLTLLFPACSDRAEPPAGDRAAILARVGDRVVTSDDFYREVERRVRQGQPLPAKEQLLDELLRREAAIYRAIKAGIDKRPEVEREFESLLIGRLREAELEEGLRALSVSEEDLRAAYQASMEDFTTPEKVRLAILNLQVSPKASEGKKAEVKARMQEAREKALAGENPAVRGGAVPGFGQLALDYSDDQASRYRGGDIGWLNAGNFDYRWPRVVLEAGFALEKDAVSEVIGHGAGFYLVKKTDGRAAATKSFAEARGILERKLLAQRRHALEDQFLRETAGIASIEVDTAALATVEVPEAPGLARAREARPPALPSVSREEP